MLFTQPTIDKNGKPLDQASIYNPPKEVKDRDALVLKDFEIADTAMAKSYEEFGNKDLVTYQNDMQKRFNNNIPPPSDDPNQAWRANTIRPLTRNKVISIVGHITESILYPTIIAQNDQSQEDKKMGRVMKDCVEWACEQAKYEEKQGTYSHFHFRPILHEIHRDCPD